MGVIDRVVERMNFVRIEKSVWYMVVVYNRLLLFVSFNGRIWGFRVKGLFGGFVYFINEFLGGWVC